MAVAAAAVLVLVTLAMVREGLRLTDGQLVYALDDPYIHMAIARNLAHFGEWGVTPGRFEPASSSPLWTLSLAGVYRLFGVSDGAPLVMNMLVGVAVILLLDRLLRPMIVSSAVRGAIALAVGLAIPLPALAVTGMESPLHVLLTLLLSWTVAGRLAGAAWSPASGDVAIAALSTLCMLTRFESCFLILPLAVVAMVRRRPGISRALIVGGVAALAAYMTFALPQGGLWLPNPVLLKPRLVDLSTFEGWAGFLTRIPDQLVWRRNSHMTALLLAAVWCLLPRARATVQHADVPRILLAVFIPAALLHIQFARLGWFFRYEAYLVALGLSGIAAALACGAWALPLAFPARPLSAGARAAAALLVVLLATPVLTRTLRSVRSTPPAMRNIHEQQYQMGRFVHAHFRDRGVAVNDLGAVGYFGGARVEDLLGLGASDVTRARLEGRFDAAFIERWCASRQVEVALVYPGWFDDTGGLPPSWRALARWTIRDNVVAGDTTVTIFATDPASTERVRAALHAFVPTLPRGVRVELID